MSKSHFFKHLSYTLYRRSLHSPSSLSPLSFSTSNSLPISSLSHIPTSYCTSLAAPADSFSITPSSAYLSVRIRCPKDVSDMLSEALLCFGASSVSVDERDGSDSFSEICIDSIFPESQNVDMSLAQAADSIGLKKIPAYEVKVGEQYDWIRKTQEFFHPVEVTEGLWIVPERSSPPDSGATNIILDPGLAFGTGEHPTTKLCLLLLHGLIKGGELVLDYGTGSGILGIAAVKFGASMSVGVDVDPLAILSARHNVALNNIGPGRMELVVVPSNPSSVVGNEGDPGSDTKELVSKWGKYDVVIANILLNPLLELADQIVCYAKPGAVVGLSGILSEQVSCIIDRYSVLLEEISVAEMDGWACVSGKKIQQC